MARIPTDFERVNLNEEKVRTESSYKMVFHIAIFFIVRRAILVDEEETSGMPSHIIYDSAKTIPKTL